MDGSPESSAPVSGEAWEGAFSGQLGGLDCLDWEVEAQTELAHRQLSAWAACWGSLLEPQSV